MKIVTPPSFLEVSCDGVSGGRTLHFESFAGVDLRHSLFFSHTLTFRRTSSSVPGGRRLSGGPQASGLTCSADRQRRTQVGSVFSRRSQNGVGSLVSGSQLNA